MCLHGSIVQLLELRDLDGRLLVSGLCKLMACARLKLLCAARDGGGGGIVGGSALSRWE